MSHIATPLKYIQDLIFILPYSSIKLVDPVPFSGLQREDRLFPFIQQISLLSETVFPPLPGAVALVASLSTPLLPNHENW